MKKLLIFLLALSLISIPVQAGKRYVHEGIVNSEFENIYLEFGRWNKKFWNIRNAKKFKSIQEALDDLPEAGGMVFIPAGTHTITSAITMKSNQALVGVGISSKIVPSADTFNIIDVVSSTSGASNDLTHILISNLGLFGLKTGTGSGIRFRGVHWSTIQNVYIEKFYNGIFLDVEEGWDADNNTILNCEIYDCLNAGIKGGGATPYAWGCEDNRITKCNIESCKYSIYIEGRLNTIANNSMEDANDIHFVIYNGDRNTIRGNTIHHGTKHGILLHDTNSNTLIGNIINDNDLDNTETYSGIRVQTNSDRNLLIGNTCYNNDRYEIVIQDDTCDKNLIIGNCCYGSDHVGAISDNGTATVVEHNIVD